MAKLEKPKHGRFSTFLHVLLCARNETSPPVHPSDHVTESEETTEQKAHSNKETIFDDVSTSTPGVVARLMGLDSLPNNTKRVVKGTTPDCVPRSKSVNFVDYLLKLDISHANANHRRVKTSSSFREVPSLVQGQKGNLFVLYMDEEQEAKKHEMKKFEKGFGELKQRKRQGSKKNEIVVSVKKERNQGKKNKKISKLKNEPRRVPSSKHSSKEVKDLQSLSSESCSCGYRYSGASSSSRLKLKLNSQLQSKEKKGFVEPKIRKSVRNKKALVKMESECSLENHSPVSVLDGNDNPFLCGAGYLDGTSTLAPKSKWVSLGDGIEERASTIKGYAITEANKEAEYYSELMLKLRTLTEQDIKESDFTLKRMCENESFEEIGLLFEHNIFDLLLYEVINEVLELYC